MAGGEGVGVKELISAKRQDRDDTLCIPVITRLFIPKNIFLRIIFFKMQRKLSPNLTVFYLQSLPPCQYYHALQKWSEMLYYF